MSEDCATTTHLGDPCGPRCIFTPAPPPLSIAVDDHGHAWQAFVTTDGSGVNLWYPAPPRWGGHSIPAKTWDELLALGKVRVLTDPGPGPRERVTRGQWPPTVGDLVIRTLTSEEQVPAGWTEWRDEQGQRVAWKTWTGPETIAGDPDAVWALRPRSQSS